MDETVKIEDITVGERLRKDYGDLSDLDTIETVGLIQPLVLDRNSSGQHRLVAGGRRLTKLEQLGYTEVYHGLTSTVGKPGFVYSSELPEDVQRECELYENICRKQMVWQERVLAIAEIHEIKKRRASLDSEQWGQAETGAEVGLTYSSVSYALKVAERLRADTTHEGRFWKCLGLTEALRLLIEEREDEAKRKVAELTAKAIPVALNNSNAQPEISIVESLEKGENVQVPLSRMLFHGKMEELCLELGPEFADHIITDWPYAIDMDMLDQTAGRDDKIRIHVERVRDEHDHEENLAMYPTWLDAMYLILKPKGYCVVFYDNVHWNLIRTHAERSGFRVQRWPLVWIKTSPCMNRMANKNWTKATEFAIVLSKENATLVKPQTTNWWAGPRADNTSNLFAKPRGLWQWILDAFALQGDVIVDPFMGEASSLTAAIDFGCRVIGMEVNEDHYNSGVSNVRELYTNLTGGNVEFS
jgi:DNA modification methylase/ParB-like chromosome segregation protein Spo0J